MATTSNQLTASSSSSSLPSWDVFLSFYGKDTRRNFIANLYFSLDQAEILTFKDEAELEKGEEISSGLLRAIHGSKMFVIVLSENYACSPWCLNELVEILNCKRKQNRVVPVFYYVDPSDLRHQKRSFGEALDYHMKRYSVDIIEKWKSALAEVAQLSGYHLKKDADEDESYTIREIVENVARHTCTNEMHLEEYLIGIDPAVEEIYQKLSMESYDVRAIGICGMGGIGKSTTAKAFYNKYSHKFDITCFIENEKQHSHGNVPLLPLLNQLLIQLLRRKDYIVRNVESGIRKLEQILSSKKALVVLDDLHRSIYSELLERLRNLFFAGSRIIITTRDANLLNQSKVDIYMVTELDEISSLELFSYHAFRTPTPPESFRKLARSFVTYAGGVPLALKVLGSSLRGRTDMSFWEGKLKRLRLIPDKEIQKILRLSYDDLDYETEKSMFLDIAFFFVGKDKDEAFSAFNSCKFFPEVGIPILIERCLLTIDQDNKFQMHNLIQHMGLEVGKGRYMSLEGGLEDLQTLEEINKTEGLELYLTKSTKRQIPAEIFEKLPKLRLLKIIHFVGHDIEGNFKDSFRQLRCLQWRNCSWEYMPSSFCPQNLVSLDMPDSRLNTLWKNPMQIKQLTDLSHLNLAGCYNLKRLPEQLGDVKGLKMIDASRTPIEQLPDSFARLINLVYLNLSHCRKLRKLPEQFGNIEGLRTFVARSSGIEQLPDSFACLINLVQLELTCCKKLTSLPDGIWKLKSLKKLNLTRCVKLERLPEQLGKMQCLEYLSAFLTNIEEIPNSIGLLSRLTDLDLSMCKKLKYMHNRVENLTSLGKLQSLALACNVSLSLPLILSLSSLKCLLLADVGPSVSSTKPLSLSKLCILQRLMLYDCTSIGPSLPQLPLHLQELRICKYAILEQLPDLCSLKELKTLELQGCIRLQSLQSLPPQLEELRVEECTRLQDVPDLSVLKKLRRLEFRGCSNLKSIDFDQSFLEARQKSDCESLYIADLPNRNIAEWFRYQSNGRTLSFDIPPNMGDDCSSVAFWIVYQVVSPLRIKGSNSIILAVIDNKTQGIQIDQKIGVEGGIVGEVKSTVRCINVNEVVTRGGRINVNVSVLRGGNIRVKKLGVHVIQRTSSASC